MVGSRGGFSNADIQIMIETNATQVNKALDSINANFAEMSGVLRDLTKAVVQNDAAQTRLARTTKSSVTHLRDWLIVIGQARAAFLNVKMVTLDTVGAIAKINSQFEKLKVLMTGLSTETDPGKRIEEVNDNIDYLIDLSKNAPYSLSTLQDAFVKLKTVGLDPANGSLQALVDAVAAFGGSDEAIQRAAVALQQMGGKGVVSMEELRQQLGEAVPTALHMMAQGANMSIKDFTKAVATGTVEATTAIKAMNREFALTYGGSAKDLMNTYDGLVSRMKTTWQLFIKEMGESTGLYDTIKDQIRAITEFLESPQGLEMAREIGNELKTILNIMSDLFKLVIEFKDEIIAFFAYVLGKNAILGLIGILGKLGSSLKAIQAAFTSFLIIPQVTAALTGFTGAVRGLLSALTLTNPILTAVMLTLVAFTSLDFVKNIAQWYKLKQAMSDLADEIERLKKAGKTINDVAYTEENLTAAQNLRLKYEKEYNRQRDKYNSKSKEWQESEDGKSYARKMEQTKQLLEEQKALLDKFEKDYGEQYANTMLANLRLYVEDSLSAIRTSYKTAMQEIQNPQNEMDDVERAELRLKKEEEIQKELEKLHKNAQKNIEAYLSSNNYDVRYKDSIEKIAKSIVEPIEKMQNELKEKIDVIMLTGSSQAQAWLEIYEKSYVDYMKASDKLEKNPIAGTKVRTQEIRQNAEESRNLLVSEMALLKTAEERLDFIKQNAKVMAENTTRTNAQIKAQDQLTKNSEKAILKVKDMASSYKEQADAAKQAYEMGVEFDTTRAQLEGNLAKEINKVVAAKRADLEITKQQVLENYDAKKYYQTLNDFAQTTADNWAKIEEINTTSNSELLDLEYDRIKKTLNYEKMSYDQRKQFDNEWQKYRESAEALYAAENKNALEQTVVEWTDWTDNMWSVWNDAFESMADKIVEFTKTGKMSMKDLFQSIVDGLVEITIKALMAQAVMSAMGSAKGAGSMDNTLGGIFNLISAGTAFGGGGVTESGGSTSWGSIGGKYMGAQVHHSGGIAGASAMTRLISPEAFVGATRYHNGGIAGLKSDEVPAILQKGEGVFTKEQMKNLGNPSVTVNVINNTQQDVSAEQGQPRFDGERVILDVVLKGMNRPGSFRDGMLGATR